MPISPPEVTTRCSLCTPLQEEPASLDFPKLLNKTTSVTTAGGAFWPNPSEQTISGRPCGLEAAVTSLQEKPEETCLLILEI